MKKNYIISGIMGGGFFAASYLLLSLGIVPSLIASAAAFGAGSLIFKDEYNLEDLGEKNKAIYKKLLDDSHKNLSLLKKINGNIADYKITTEVKKIIVTTDKIIKLLHEKPDKINSSTKFLNYYLPITIKILERFDEIENQELTSNSSVEFVDKTRNLVVKIAFAFENQLNNLYNDEIIDTNAEIKVFESILKSDGLLAEKINKDGDKSE